VEIGGRCLVLRNLLHSCAIVLKSWSLNLLEPSSLVQDCTGIALIQYSLSLCRYSQRTDQLDNCLQNIYVLNNINFRQNVESLLLYHGRTDRQTHAYCLLTRRSSSILRTPNTRGGTYLSSTARDNHSLPFLYINLGDIMVQQLTVCFNPSHLSWLWHVNVKNWSNESCLTLHLLHAIRWNANLMQLCNFIDVFLARHVSGTYAHQ